MIRATSLIAIATILAGASPAFAASSSPLSSLDSFRVGNKGVLCTAQRRSEDDRYSSMFDRAYDIVCRDAATPVGKVYVLKGGTGALAQFDAKRAAATKCNPLAAVDDAPVANTRKGDCTDSETGLNMAVYALERSKIFYAVEGLSAYDSALRLALQSVVADNMVPGEVSVATTNAGDPAAFAKVQAASLDPEQALAAGYSRNIEGSYAEASEFFEALVGRSRSENGGANKPAEYLANQAMQQSNLGNAAEADRLFREAARIADAGEPLFNRQFRNMKAMHRLNNRDAAAALEILSAEVPVLAAAAGTEEKLRKGIIERKLSQRLAIDDAAMSRFGGGVSRLTDNEKATLLDAQATYLRGAALRMQGKSAEAKGLMTRALQALASVRGGYVTSMAWMIASASNELAQMAEEEKNYSAAEGHLRQALATYQANVPESATLLAGKARLASLQARHGDRKLALDTYRELVKQAASIPGGAEALRPLIHPYFDALISEKGADAAKDFFAASQAMVRPGVAQTQAVLARELSGGSDEASTLFRQSVNMTREIVAVDVEIARLSALETRTADVQAALDAAQKQRKTLGAEQTALLAKLAAFPKFRVMSNATLELAGLQKELRGDEGYYKLLLVGEAAYGIFANSNQAKIFKVDATRAELESMTNTIRDSIVVEEANQLTTKPFDLATSHKMYQVLFGAVSDDVARVKHLVFEPDGPLLKLPANVLVTTKESVDAYAARQKEDNPDEFDFTGVSWLGKDRMVSTAVSAQSFVDVRKIAPSKAKRRYLGVGQNTPVEKLAHAPKSDEGRDPCDWELSLWSKPISGAELQLASQLLGGADNEVILEEGYSDSALRDRKDLRDFRIIQFATHGLVTAPKPGCPARPALVTSFGTQASDGLLSFKEIFDLKLDADTIILSACDTAGAATLAATREAGITTGGNFAMDGLVRAFVGAGARAVIASHWPVPDDYQATKKLMSVIYEGGTTEAVGESMRKSQNRLMDDPLTSHPYYWAAFAIVGDAAKPLTSGGNAQLAQAETTESK